MAPEAQWAVAVTWVAKDVVELEATKGTRIARMTMSAAQAERLAEVLLIAAANAKR